jgi:hypothetical protein
MASEEHTFVLKTETDAIAATTVCVLTLYDPAHDGLWSFADHPSMAPISDGIEIALLADDLVVHSDYALRTLERLYGVEFDRTRIFDTLKMAEMVRGKGGNGLSAWAARLGIARDNFHGAEHWSPEAQRHCEHDARIIGALLQHLGTLVDG